MLGFIDVGDAEDGDAEDGDTVVGTNVGIDDIGAGVMRIGDDEVSQIVGGTDGP